MKPIIWINKDNVNWIQITEAPKEEQEAFGKIKLEVNYADDNNETFYFNTIEDAKQFWKEIHEGWDLKITK